MMKKAILGLLISMMLVMSIGLVMAQPTIDGTIGASEWTAYLLGTSSTGWSGGMEVDVYGYADATHLYAAYVADTGEPGWATTAALCIGSNLYYKTPTTISWPDPGYTIVGFFGDGYGRTDGVSWIWPDSYGNCNWVSRGIEFVAGHPCGWSTVGTPSHAAGPNANVIEIKIPLSQLTYAGDNGQIALGGQYWQYDGATTFYVTLPPPTKGDTLKNNGVPGGGIDNAPGQQKEVPNDNFGQGTANKP